MADKLLPAAQLSILTALAFDDGPYGVAIAAQLRPDHFDDIYRDFAAELLRHRRRYSSPPGKAHIRELASRAGFRGKNDPVIKQIIPQMELNAPSLNAEYVLASTQDFIRRQTVQAAIQRAIDRFEVDDAEMPADIEQIFSEALATRSTTVDSGVYFPSKDALQFLQRRQTSFISLGIPLLDRERIGLQPKKLLLYVAPKATGKSWFCVHCGKRGIMSQKRVVHITLEMSEDEVLERYAQAFFGMAVDSEVIKRMEFDWPKSKKQRDQWILDHPPWHQIEVQPKLTLEDARIKVELDKRMKKLGQRVGKLVVKEFPTGSLTPAALISYLDLLEAVDGFVPNILIVDYPKLMKTDPNNVRIDIGRNMEQLRGIAGARNLALVCPHQSNRATIGARRVRSSNVSEDISVIQTADVVLTYARTRAEERDGLGRLTIEHARNARSGLELMLSQSYGTGQYVLEAARMRNEYWDFIKKDEPADDTESSD